MATSLDLELWNIWRQYQAYIGAYFPPEELQNAACILRTQVEYARRVCPSLDPANCIANLGSASCYTGQAATEAKAYGLWQIVDVCWAPQYAGDQTPFTQDEWSRVLDPNVNTWMASVVWSIGGWRAWVECGACNICDVRGGPVPYPRHPVTVNPLNPWPVIAGVGTVLGLLGLGWWESRRGF